MPETKRPLNAWKHGGYSSLGVLPGEEPEEFNHLHQSLVREWQPSGASECDTVLSITKCIWRKTRLTIYSQLEIRKQSVAEDPLSRAWYAWDEVVRKQGQVSPSATPKQEGVVVEEDERQLQQDALAAQELAELEQITPESLIREIELESRLDARIDRLFKRLFQLKAVKEMMGLAPLSHDASPATADPQRRPDQLGRPNTLVVLEPKDPRLPCRQLSQPQGQAGGGERPALSNRRRSQPRKLRP
jgi:hypothetical protein